MGAANRRTDRSCPRCGIVQPWTAAELRAHATSPDCQPVSRPAPPPLSDRAQRIIQIAAAGELLAMLERRHHRSPRMRKPL